MSTLKWIKPAVIFLFVVLYWPLPAALKNSLHLTASIKIESNSIDSPAILSTTFICSGGMFRLVFHYTAANYWITEPHCLIIVLNHGDEIGRRPKKEDQRAADARILKGNYANKQKPEINFHHKDCTLSFNQFSQAIALTCHLSICKIFYDNFYFCYNFTFLKFCIDRSALWL